MSCAVCFTAPPEVVLMQCGRCKKRQYCSRTCQKMDWDSHKDSCTCGIVDTEMQIAFIDRDANSQALAALLKVSEEKLQQEKNLVEKATMAATAATNSAEKAKAAASAANAAVQKAHTAIKNIKITQSKKEQKKANPGFVDIINILKPTTKPPQSNSVPISAKIEAAMELLLQKQKNANPNEACAVEELEKEISRLQIKEHLRKKKMSKRKRAIERRWANVHSDSSYSHPESPNQPTSENLSLRVAPQQTNHTPSASSSSLSSSPRPSSSSLQSLLIPSILPSSDSPLRKSSWDGDDLSKRKYSLVAVEEAPTARRNSSQKKSKPPTPEKSHDSPQRAIEIPIISKTKQTKTKKKKAAQKKERDELIVSPDGIVMDRNTAIDLQLEYYFSPTNLIRDVYLRSNMSDRGYVPLAVVARFFRLSCLLRDPSDLLKAVKTSRTVKLKADGIRPRVEWWKWIFPPQPASADSDGEDEKQQGPEVQSLHSLPSKSL